MLRLMAMAMAMQAFLLPFPVLCHLVLWRWSRDILALTHTICFSTFLHHCFPGLARTADLEKSEFEP
jgi:hypothetical protein